MPQVAQSIKNAGLQAQTGRHHAKKTASTPDNPHTSRNRRILSQILDLEKRIARATLSQHRKRQ